MRTLPLAVVLLLATSWADEYERILKLFETNLSNEEMDTLGPEPRGEDG